MFSLFMGKTKNSFFDLDLIGDARGWLMTLV
jgi:hypothetical protein